MRNAFREAVARQFFPFFQCKNFADTSLLAQYSGIRDQSSISRNREGKICFAVSLPSATFIGSSLSGQLQLAQKTEHWRCPTALGDKLDPAQWIGEREEKTRCRECCHQQESAAKCFRDINLDGRLLRR